MKTDLYTKTILSAIAALLAVLAFRQAPPVMAQNQKRDLWIEPGFTSVRKPDGTEQVPGKIVVDKATGDIWGFPTLTSGPYPVDTTSARPASIRTHLSGQVRFLRHAKAAPVFRDTLRVKVPVDITSARPPESEPVYLGRFDFSAVRK
jgi:hypothetical protein